MSLEEQSQGTAAKPKRLGTGRTKPRRQDQSQRTTTSPWSSGNNHTTPRTRRRGCSHGTVCNAEEPTRRNQPRETGSQGGQPTTMGGDPTKTTRIPTGEPREGGAVHAPDAKPRNHQEGHANQTAKSIRTRTNPTDQTSPPKGASMVTKTTRANDQSQPGPTYIHRWTSHRDNHPSQVQNRDGRNTRRSKSSAPDQNKECVNSSQANRTGQGKPTNTGAGSSMINRDEGCGQQATLPKPFYTSALRTGGHRPKPTKPNYHQCGPTCPTKGCTTTQANFPSPAKPAPVGLESVKRERTNNKTCCVHHGYAPSLDDHQREPTGPEQPRMENQPTNQAEVEGRTVPEHTG